MAKDPIATLSALQAQLYPKVRKVVEDCSKALWSKTVASHLSGAGSNSLARRTGTLARSTRAIPVTLEGKKVVGGVGFSAEYAGVHIGPAGSKVTITPKNKKFLAIPLAAARTAAGVPRGKPLDGIWGPTFISKGVIFGFSGGTRGSKSKTPIPLFVLKRSVVVPQRVDPDKDLLDWIKPKFMSDLAQVVKT